MAIKHKGRFAKKIAKRDGWRCWICGGEIDKRLNPPHLMARTLDHIEPRSLWGTDDIRNLRLAHARCNHERGVKDVEPNPIWLENRPVARRKREGFKSVRRRPIYL